MSNGDPVALALTGRAISYGPWLIREEEEECLHASEGDTDRWKGFVTTTLVLGLVVSSVLHEFLCVCFLLEDLCFHCSHLSLSLNKCVSPIHCTSFLQKTRGPLAHSWLYFLFNRWRAHIKSIYWVFLYILKGQDNMKKLWFYSLIFPLTTALFDALDVSIARFSVLTPRIHLGLGHSVIVKEEPFAPLVPSHSCTSAALHRFKHWFTSLSEGSLLLSGEVQKLDTPRRVCVCVCTCVQVLLYLQMRLWKTISCVTRGEALTLPESNALELNYDMNSYSW